MKDDMDLEDMVEFFRQLGMDVLVIDEDGVHHLPKTGETGEVTLPKDDPNE